MEDITELYRVWRPVSFKEVFGQDEVVATLKAFLTPPGAMPHTTLLTGPSGCGKTTLARILREKIGCHEKGLVEINAAESKGIDMVRDLCLQMSTGHLGGRIRVYIIDECHKLTSDAQSALLKVLEDTPRHVYFFLCTTDPGKLLATIKTRCTHLKLAAATPAAITACMRDVLSKVGATVSDRVLAKIADAADGSFRAALVHLNTVLKVTGEDAQMAAITKDATERRAFDLVKALLWERSDWPLLVKILKDLKEQAVDVEPLRRALLSCAAGELLKGTAKAAWCNLIIDYFGKNFFDSGFPGLCAACYEVMQVRTKR